MKSKFIITAATMIALTSMPVSAYELESFEAGIIDDEILENQIIDDEILENEIVEDELLGDAQKYISDALNPRIYVETKDKNGNSIEKIDGNVDAIVTIIDVAGNNNLDGSAKILYQDIIKKDKDYSQFKVRGNSTAHAQKKPYNIKLNKKKDILGMGEAKKWCLLANFFDPTFFRNSIAFDMADKLGLEYTSKKRPVELFVDGKYKGLYLLTEAVEDGPSRVDIDIEKDDFIVESNADRTEEGVTYVTTKSGFRYEMSAPDEDIAPEKLTAVTKALNDVESAIASGDYSKVKEAVDVDSFAKVYLINEIAKTVDFPRFSSFMYYKDGVLHAGPIWDYDMAFGNVNETINSLYSNCSKTTGRLLATDNQSSIYAQLLKYDEFNKSICDIFNSNYEYFKGLAADGGSIDQYATTYYEYILKSYKDCGYDFASYKTVDGIERKPDASYDDNVKFFKNWLKKRIDWLHKCLITAGNRRENVETIFDDIKADKWYKAAIAYAYESGYMNGCGEKKFAPDDSCTRSQFVQIVYNMQDRPGGTDVNPFTDVAKGKWYTNAITWAVANDVTKGTSATTFGIDQKITREEAAQFFMNYAKWCGFDVSKKGVLDQYSDKDQVSAWAKNSGALEWATYVGIMKGYSDGRLGPKDLCTRAQIAQMIYNFDKMVVK